MTGGDDTRLAASNREVTDHDGPTVEAYESEGKTVLYESANPLAWIESSVSFPVQEVA